MSEWLIDTSALVWLSRSPDAALWAEHIEAGSVRIATVTRLEVGYSVRSGTDLRDAVRRPPLAAMPLEYQTPAIEDRALDVQMRLADQGHHRAPSVPDLIVAATALAYDLTLVSSNTDDFKQIRGLRQLDPRTGRLVTH